jgi:hypothetical protein
MYLELWVIRKYKNIVDNWGTGKHFTEANLKKIKIEKYDYIEKHRWLFILTSDFFNP